MSRGYGGRQPRGLRASQHPIAHTQSMKTALLCLMHAQRLMFVGVVLTFIGIMVVPTSASCPGPMTLDDQFASSQAVFVGRALAQQIVLSNSGFRGRAAETTFEVQELWKGQADAKTLRVLTCGWIDGRETVTCGGGVTFVVGSRYVVFATGDPLWSTECQQATSLMDRAKDTLQWLVSKPRLAVRQGP